MHLLAAQLRRSTLGPSFSSQCPFGTIAHRYTYASSCRRTRSNTRLSTAISVEGAVEGLE